MTSIDQRTRRGGCERGRLPASRKQLSLRLPPADGDGHRPPVLRGIRRPHGYIRGLFIVGWRRVGCCSGTADVTEAMSRLEAAYLTARWLHDDGEHALLDRVVAELRRGGLARARLGKPRLDA